MALNPKQKVALELLTSGLGMTYTAIAEQAGVTDATLWKWRNYNEEFKTELNRLNTLRWEAAEDAARESCISLCRSGNQKMVEFVLKNIGYNPTQKVEANVSTDIEINIVGGNEGNNGEDKA